MSVGGLGLVLPVKEGGKGDCVVRRTLDPRSQ